MVAARGLSHFALMCAGLRRKPLRSILLVASISIAFLLYTVLGAFERGFTGAPAVSERLIVTNKSGMRLTLPARQRDQIAAVAGVGLVTGIARMRAYWRDPAQVLGVNAVDPDSYAAFFSDLYAFEPALITALNAQRDGAIVGRAIAERMGITPGMQVTLTALSERTATGGLDWPVHVVGILDGKQPGVDTNFAVIRYDYFNAARATGIDTVSSFGILPAPGVSPAEVIKAVDQRFTNSAEPTRTQTESEYMKAFVAQFANVGAIVRIVVGAAFATILMIVANTMLLAVGERRRDIAVMKVLGFSGGAILRGVLAETALIFTIGLGMGLAVAAIALAILADPLAGIAPGLALDPGLAIRAAAIAVVLAIATAALPALRALRVPAVDALRGA